MLYPLYSDLDGHRGNDPLALMQTQPTIALEPLALLLSGPAFYGEFAPQSPWRELTRIREIPESCHDGTPLDEAFRQAVRAGVGDAEVIGVTFSGGLDSLATLYHAAELARADGRRVVAATVDMIDDDGNSSAAVARRLISDVGLGGIELLTLQPSDRATPQWSPHGPRLDAMPGVAAAMAVRLAEAGAQVLLTGCGSDELLGVPRYATLEIARRHGARGAGVYLADVGVTGPGILGEALAGALGLAPAALRARVYWAVNNVDPSATGVSGEGVLTEQMIEFSRLWADGYTRAAIQEHAAHTRSWMAADVHDKVWPHDLIFPASELRESHPFFEGPFLTRALALNPADRFDPSLPSRYHRCKAQVIKLLPESVRHALPLHKQLFSKAFERGIAPHVHAPLAIEAGLIDPARLKVCADPNTLQTVQQIEWWLNGAAEIGAIIESAH